MLKRLKNKLDFKKYDFLTKHVVKLDPLKLKDDSNFSVLSMLCKRDIYQYLVSLRSFLQYAKPRRVIIVNDGTLKAREQEILMSACPGVIIEDIEKYAISGLPRGGCWERIGAVAHFSQDDYIIQLDADTLFRKPPESVLEAIEAQRSFALPTDSGTHVVKARESIEFAKKRKIEGIDHIQIDAEANLDVMGDIDSINYIRACAGFGGYAPGVITPEKLLDVSKRFEGLFGERWKDWGTEQFTSNYLLANDQKLIVLPISEYDSVDKYKESLAFVHFIGCFRFDHGIYVKESRELIKKLQNS